MTSPGRLLLALAATASVLCWSDVARAGDTWCIGGFSFDPLVGDGGGHSKHACYKRGRASGITGDWHWHDQAYVSKDNQTCYTCWDEEDNTCSSIADARDGWKPISAQQCADMGVGRKNKADLRNANGPVEPPEDPIDIVQVPIDPFTPDPVDAPPDDPPPAPLPRDDQVIFNPTPDPPTSAPGPKAGPKKPRPPTKRQVHLKLDLSPGPYAVNDPITVTGFAYTKAGRRRVDGGTIVVLQNGQPLLGADGAPLKIRARKTPRGTATATFSIPSGGTLTLRFVPDSVQSQRGETLLGPDQPGEVTITVGQCRLRGVVISPADGELIAASEKSKVLFRGRFDNTSGAASTDLGGATPVFTVEVGGQTHKVTASADGSEFVGELEVDPPDGTTSDMIVRLIGEGGQSDVCPGTSASARITRLGIGLDLETVGNCYVDRPCQVKASFVMPRGASQAAAVEFATAADLEMLLFARGANVASLTPEQPGVATTSFTGTYTPAGAGVVHLRAMARAAAAGREVDDKLDVTIREPIVLALPPLLDLGTVAAGSAWPAGCQTLDFSKSRGVIEQSFHLVASKPSGCESIPALESGGLGVPMNKGVDIEFAYNTLAVRICLAEVPRCAAESPDPITLTITPNNPDFADQAKPVKLKWRVDGRNFIACHWWWIAVIGGGILFLLVGYGFIKPSNFSPHDSLKMASDRKKLMRAVGRRLRELPGGRSGWYRSAATGIRDDGSATSKKRLATVVIAAHKGDIYLHSRGGLQRVNPGSKKLEPVDTGKDGIPAGKGIIYNVGSLFFQIG